MAGGSPGARRSSSIHSAVNALCSTRAGSAAGSELPSLGNVFSRSSAPPTPCLVARCTARASRVVFASGALTSNSSPPSVTDIFATTDLPIRTIGIHSVSVSNAARAVAARSLLAISASWSGTSIGTLVTTIGWP